MFKLKQILFSSVTFWIDTIISRSIDLDFSIWNISTATNVTFAVNICHSLWVLLRERWLNISHGVLFHKILRVSTRFSTILRKRQGDRRRDYFRTVNDAILKIRYRYMRTMLAIIRFPGLNMLDADTPIEYILVTYAILLSPRKKALTVCRFTPKLVSFATGWLTGGTKTWRESTGQLGLTSWLKLRDFS